MADSEAGQSEIPTSIVVLGASGDLAKKKTYPSLYALFEATLLPANCCIYGYARRPKDDNDFREHLRGYLPETSEVDAFLKICFYRQGSYDSVEDMRKVADEMEKVETEMGNGSEANRLFYFALPPSVFEDAARSIHGGALTTRGWNRVVIEKPFGKDSASSRALSEQIAKYFTEDQVYRIDHYLGKEMVQNLMILRFANSVFEPLWNRNHISSVQISFKEPFGTEGRGGYFDEYGIIRDVIQNHLLQVLSLTAMEPPVSLNSEDVRDEKVKVLRCMRPASLDTTVLGQYGKDPSGTKPSYLDDETVPEGSTCPTFATTVLFVDNPRWAGVPFIMKSGKALAERKAEIRIQFRSVANRMFSDMAGTCAKGDGSTCVTSEAVHENELVIRIQPNEAVYLKVMAKLPGLTGIPVETELNLSYKNRFPTRPVPDAYSRLILDVLRGEQSQFVRSDELAAAWAIFTPLLHKIEAEKVQPIIYPYGSRGPVESDRLIARYGYKYDAKYSAQYNRVLDPSKPTESLDKLKQDFSLPLPRLQAMLNVFLDEMRAGLAGSDSTIKMLPSYVTRMPNGSEKGVFWAIDVGGTNLRVVSVELDGASGLTIKNEIAAPVPRELRHGRAVDLFTHIATTLKSAGAKGGDKVGFTFSFPIQSTAVDSATLIEWTKDWTAKGVEGQDVVEMLRLACHGVGLDVNIVAVVNDTVGTMMARRYEDINCKVGVILGTGTNAAYIERKAAIGKWRGCRDGEMVVNMEWGGFGSGDGGRRLLPLTAIDHELDALTPNSGRQRYEKMIGGQYLGELARLALLSLGGSGLIWGEETVIAPSSPLKTPWAVGSHDLSTMAADDTEDLNITGSWLADHCGVPTTTVEERQVVKDVCVVVARRGARLAACGVAAVIAQMGADADEDTTVGVDGSLFKKHPFFRVWMAEALHEMGCKCHLVDAEDGSGKGAAVTASVVQLQDPAECAVAAHPGFVSPRA